MVAGTGWGRVGEFGEGRLSWTWRISSVLGRREVGS